MPRARTIRRREALDSPRPRRLPYPHVLPSAREDGGVFGNCGAAAAAGRRQGFLPLREHPLDGRALGRTRAVRGVCARSSAE
eukprot:2124328-Rhodomonas_salina.1